MSDEQAQAIDQTHFPEGMVQVRYLKMMSKESIDELEEMFDLILKKLRRWSEKHTEGAT